MKSHSDLYRLVEVMTPAEKRYFKVFCKRHIAAQTGNYQTLFDLISKYGFEEEEEVRNQFEKKIKKKIYTETKYLLFQQVMKSLQSYYAEFSIEQKIRNKIQQCEILFEKGLSYSLRKMLAKTIEYAKYYEKYEMVLYLLKMDRKANLFVGKFDDLSAFMERHRKAEKLHMAELTNFYEMQEIGDRLYLFYANHGVVRSKEIEEEFLKVFDHPQLVNVEDCISYRAKVWFYYCHRTKAFMMQDHKSLLHYALKFLETMEESVFLIEESPLQYISAVEGIIMAKSDLKQWDDIEPWFERMRRIPKENKLFDTEMNKAWLFEASYRMQLSYFISSAQYQRAKEIMPEVEEGLKKYGHAVSGANTLLLKFNQGLSAFGYEDYELALVHFNDICDTFDPEWGREDIKAISKILLLLVHYELNNIELLPYVIRSTYRYLVKSERLYPTEKLLLKFLRKLPGIRDNEELVREFGRMSKELRANRSDELTDVFHLYFGFIAWLESKVKGISFQEAVLEELDSSEYKVSSIK